jgi:hypothetical protein
VLGHDSPQNMWNLDVYMHPVPRNAAAQPAKQAAPAAAAVANEKYSADDRKQMAGKGHAMPDGSYPIGDEEDLHNAIHAVGRGGSDHDAIRRHIIKRAAALGASSAVPDNWNADGSVSDLSDAEIWAALADPKLFQLDAGKE